MISCLIIMKVEESWILEDEENEEIDSVEDDTDQKEEEEN